jgi:hypothetical protein
VKPVTLVDVVLAYQGIMYTTREKVIGLGPLTASVEAVEAAERYS